MDFHLKGGTERMSKLEQLKREQVVGTKLGEAAPIG